MAQKRSSKTRTDAAPRAVARRLVAQLADLPQDDCRFLEGWFAADENLREAVDSVERMAIALAVVGLLTVRDWLGHTSVAQTSTYLASTLHTQYEAMKRFDELRGLRPGEYPAAQGTVTTIESGEGGQGVTESGSLYASH